MLLSVFWGKKKAKMNILNESLSSMLPSSLTISSWKLRTAEWQCSCYCEGLSAEPPPQRLCLTFPAHLSLGWGTFLFGFSSLDSQDVILLTQLTESSIVHYREVHGLQVLCCQFITNYFILFWFFLSTNWQAQCEGSGLFWWTKLYTSWFKPSCLRH